MDTLRFSRRSWHYWLYNRSLFFFLRGHRAGAKNLCAYFWSIVFIVVFNIVFFSFVLLGLVALAVTIATHLLTVLLILAVVLAMAALFGGYWLLLDALEKSTAKRRATAVPKERKPNLLWEFLKAKKHKYCPMIEWQD